MQRIRTYTRTRMIAIAGSIVAASTVAAAPAVPAYPHARALCNEHVIANHMHVEWSTVATTDDVGTVVAFYEKALGAKARPGSQQEQSFEPDADRRISIYPASAIASFPHCDAAPTAGERAVILSSTAIR